MKAIILAAGKGERLKEITNSIPKPMIEFKGKPILEHNIDLCRKYGITEIYINLYHLSEKITDYFGNGEKFGVSIKYSYEDELLGTAGAVKKIAKDFWNYSQLHNSTIQQFNSIEPFFVIYGDNFSDYNLELLVEKQKSTNAKCIIAFHYREDVSHSGVAEFNNDLRITKFIEKPKEGETDSHWVNAGIYLLTEEIFRQIEDGFSDFGKDIFPKLLSSGEPIFGICADTDVKAFDTREMYNKNII